MSDEHTTDRPATAARPRRPVIALMGEFSAGKSTLTNLLVGAKSLPVQVTATQLPPVWLSHGALDPIRVDLFGAEHGVDLSAPETIDLNDTQHLRVFRQADLLELCDLIDMPGISDPNMASDVWQRALHHADAVIWCSHATQAWRQSEAAVWEMMPADVKARSILLLTRFDKITNDKDRSRVLRRVAREAADQFAHILPISLLEALSSGDDRTKWEASGAQEFVAALINTIQHLNAGTQATHRQPYQTPQTAPDNVVRLEADDAAGPRNTPDDPPSDPDRIMPRRVRRGGVPATERPPRDAPSPDPSSSVGHPVEMGAQSDDQQATPPAQSA